MTDGGEILPTPSNELVIDTAVFQGLVYLRSESWAWSAV
jgi:hypothetical protein